jgi:PIN domain nuclease of toxin-antitoxin system
LGSAAVILLDTHVVFWAGGHSQMLSKDAASAIRRARRSDGVAISAISIWELASLFSRGKIQGSGTIEASIQELLGGVTVLPITPEIGALATQFPNDYPHDPVDRLIGATARAEGMTLVTRDERIRRSLLVRTVW